MMGRIDVVFVPREREWGGAGPVVGPMYWLAWSLALVVSVRAGAFTPCNGECRPDAEGDDVSALQANHNWEVHVM